MNERLNVLFQRRSIRDFQIREVSDSLVTDILQAAMAAPSAAGKDPWRFLIVRERATLEKLAPSLSNGKILLSGAMALVACGDLEAAHDRQLSFLLQDVSAAIQNILLAASMLGLGTCWLAVHPREERMALVRSTLSLPERVVPVAVIALGWPAEKKEARTRFEAAKVHGEKW
jgi:nitroreductase